MTDNTKNAEQRDTLRHRLMQKARERRMEMLAEARKRKDENDKAKV